MDFVSNHTACRDSQAEGSTAEHFSKEDGIVPDMQFSPERIQELIQIHKERFDEELTVDEASEMGARLVELLTLLAQPLPSEIAARQKSSTPPSSPDSSAPSSQQSL